MTARFSAMNHASHCCTAAACSSARISLVLDTVALLAVSIFVSLLSLRIRLC